MTDIYEEHCQYTEGESTIPNEVREAAAFLDGAVPGWWLQIDLSRLSQAWHWRGTAVPSDNPDTILAQLFGDADRALIELNLSEDSGAAYYGFIYCCDAFCPEQEHDRATPQWRKQIFIRREREFENQPYLFNPDMELDRPTLRRRRRLR